MTKPSRRKLHAGVARTRSAAISDELAGKAAAWIASDQHLTAMQLQWQDLENQLFTNARRLNLNYEDAGFDALPEAQAMKALDRKIEAAQRQLDATAGELSAMKATTIAGAVAKIELGLKVQGVFDWRNHALELLEGGVGELRSILMMPPG